MLAIAKMGRHSRYYYANLAQPSGELSTAQPGEPPGQWMGGGATALGLQGTIHKSQFLKVFDGLSPDGTTALVANARGKYRVPGWDLTFTMPKSLSILWANSTSDIQRQIEACHHQAVQSALAYLERQSRLLTSDAPAAQLVVACYEHGSNRAEQPNLHTHALVLNSGVTATGTTGPLDSRVFYRHKMAAGALYRCDLSERLQRQLGISLVREKGWFELQGFSRVKGPFQALVNHWSSRRREIEAQQPLTAAQAQTLAYVTRQSKTTVPPRDLLFAQWQAESAQFGFGPHQAQHRLGHLPAQSRWWQQVQEWRTLREARTQVVRHQNHFKSQDLVRALAEAGQTRGLSAERCVELTDKCLRHRQVLSLGVVRGEERFTLKRLYRLEQQLLSQGTSLERQPGKRVSLRHQDRAALAGNLSTDQRQALQVLTGRGGLKILTGLSGSGKTTTLCAAAQAYQASGARVVMVSQSRRESEQLHHATVKHQGLLSHWIWGELPQSVTLQGLFQGIVRAEESRLRYGDRSVVPHPLAEAPVVLVDNAQVFSATQLLQLIREVRAANGTLVLCGDLKAPQAYAQSGGLKALAQTVSHTQLTKLHRQVTEPAKALVRAIAQEPLPEWVKVLRQDGGLNLSDSPEQAMAQLLDDWFEQAKRSPQSQLIMADTPEQVLRG
jgi:conjugative relaxase-like TrwC/TraI family protein